MKGKSLMFKHGCFLLAAWMVGVGASARAAGPANQGDVRSIKFVVPFKDALKKAKEENRLILLKPIYGGVDQLGARDYRCGSW